MDGVSSLPAFLRSDSEESFASAAPKGGLVPTGLAGAQQGLGGFS